ETAELSPLTRILREFVLSRTDCDRALQHGRAARRSCRRTCAPVRSIPTGVHCNSLLSLSCCIWGVIWIPESVALAPRTHFNDRPAIVFEILRDGSRALLVQCVVPTGGPV